MDNVRPLVTMSEVAQFREGHKVRLPNFIKEVFEHAEVIEGTFFQTIKEEEWMGDAEEAERSHQKDWSIKKGWAKGLLLWVKWLGGKR